MSMNRWGVAAAGLFAVAAVVLAVRTVWTPTLRASSGAGARDESAAAPTDPALPPFTLPTDPTLETQVTPENADEVADAIAGAVAGAAAASRELSGLGAQKTDALRRAALEQMRIYLPGSFDRYKEHLDRSGARYALLDRAGDDPKQQAEAWRIIRGVFEANAPTFALKPVSVDSVKVRLRFRDGAPVSPGDDGYMMERSQAADRFPHLAGDPRQSRATIVELLVPFFYVRPPNTQATAYWSLWFTWDQPAGEWRISQTALVSPRRIGMFQGPVW